MITVAEEEFVKEEEQSVEEEEEPGDCNNFFIFGIIEN